MAGTHLDSGIDESSTWELFETGCALCEGGDPAEALIYLRSAYETGSHHPRIRSYYGLCLGLVERSFDESLTLCQSAAKQEFFNPDLYLNLARLYLGFGFKAEGVRFLRRGLMIDPGHAAIASVLQELGDRSSAVLRFLPRRHPINRWLGAARYMITRRVGLGIAA